MLAAVSLPTKATCRPSGDHSAPRLAIDEATRLVAGEEPSAATTRRSNRLSQSVLVGKMSVVPSGDHVRPPLAQ
jgi:hypothetical protein